MATKWTSPVWRMPENSNQSKLDNYSLDFDGSDHIALGTSSISLANSFSISMWIKPSSLSGFQMLFSGSGYSGGTGIGHYIYNDTVWTYVSSSGTAVAIFKSSSLLNTNDWTHIIIQRNAGVNWQMWVNGVLEETNSSTQLSLDLTSANSMIARHYNSSYNFNGKISQTTIFDYALSETQVKYLFNNNAGGSTPNPQNPMAIAGPTPIAYYPLGGSSTGSSSTLTIPNESGSGDTVFDFIPNDYFTCGNVLNQSGTDAFSVSGWIKYDTTKSNTIVSKMNSSFVGYQVYINAANKLKFLLQGTGNLSGTGATALSANNWYHIVVTYDGSGASSGINFYINGNTETFTGSGSNSGGVSNSENFQIGARTGTLDAIDGKLSNIQIFNTVLPATGSNSVETLYNNGTPLSDMSGFTSLQGWWKMNVDTSNWNGSNWILNEQNANYTTALNFPGGTDFIDFGTGFPTTLGASATAVTAAGWVKINDLTQQQALFNITTAGGNYYGSFSIWYHQSSNQLQGYIGGNSNKILLNSGITDNKWHHLALVYNQSAGATITDGLKLYLDGDLVTPSSSGGSTPASVDFTSSTLSTRLGWGWSNTYTAVAEMSNWAMWNSALTSGNITTLYNGGTPETTISLSPVSYYKLDNTTTGIQDAGSASNNGTITGSITQVDSNVSVLNGISSGMTTANLVTSDLNRSLLYSSYSMDFEGTDDKITLNSSISTGNDYSVSFWLNPENVSSGNSYIFSDSTTSPYKGLALDQGSSTAGGFGNFYYYTGSVNVVNNTAISGDSWSHIVITFDVTGQEIKFYVNGVLDKTTTSVANIGTLINEFGTRSAGNYFNGKLSNISVFNKVLSQNEILTIYNGGAPNDISSLSPVGWWSLSGDSYFATNWICPDLSTNSNNGTSNGIPVTALVGDAPGSTGNGTGTSMDIPTNLQGNAPNSDKNAISVNMVPTNRVSGSGNVP